MPTARRALTRMDVTLGGRGKGDRASSHAPYPLCISIEPGWSVSTRNVMG